MLPRDPSGKLPAERLAAIAEQSAARQSSMAPIELKIAEDHPSFPGHFPGRPLLPGVALLAEVLEAVLADPDLAAAVGPAPRLAAAKFLAPVGPGATLALRFETTSTALRFEISNGERRTASGHFELARKAEAEACPSTRAPIAP